MQNELPPDIKKILGSNEKVLFTTVEQNAFVNPKSLYLTDKKIIVRSPGILTSNIDIYMYKDIMSVKIQKGVIWSGITITTAWRDVTGPSVNTFTIGGISHDDAYTAVRLIQERV